MLDSWRLEDWLALFDAQARYVIEPLERLERPDGEVLALAVDDKPRLAARVGQILGAFAWTERPRSRTRRLVSGVRIPVWTAERIRIEASFAVHQFRNEESCVFVGSVGYELVRTDAGVLVREKRIRLDDETIDSQRRISILL